MENERSKDELRKDVLYRVTGRRFQAYDPFVAQLLDRVLELEEERKRVYGRVRKLSKEWWNKSKRDGTWKGEDAFREAIPEAFGEMQEEKGPGMLEIGTNSDGEVVVNLDHDRTGHIVFSVLQGREFARTVWAMCDRAVSEMGSGASEGHTQVNPFEDPKLKAMRGVPVPTVDLRGKKIE